MAESRRPHTVIAPNDDGTLFVASLLPDGQGEVTDSILFEELTAYLRARYLGEEPQESE